MPKFRKKPVVIEAEQYKVSGKMVRGVCMEERCHVNKRSIPHVHTIHGGQPIEIVDGDWIIPEPDGLHFYPCKQDIFEETYERVEEE